MKITKVELYLNECYGCKSARYIPLHDWFLSLGLPLGKFEARRVPLSREWQQFAKDMADKGIKMPLVAIHTDGEVECYVYNYDKFIENVKKGKEMNLTKEQLDALRDSILVKPLKEEKEASVSVINMKKKAHRKKQAVVKKDKTATTAVE